MSSVLCSQVFVKTSAGPIKRSSAAFKKVVKKRFRLKDMPNLPISNTIKTCPNYKDITVLLLLLLLVWTLELYKPIDGNSFMKKY